MRKPIPMLFVLLAVGACATDDEFGATVNHNVAAQAVDMTPQYAGTPMEGTNGRRASDAYRRYLNGNVKQLLKVEGGVKVGAQGGAGEAAATGN